MRDANTLQEEQTGYFGSAVFSEDHRVAALAHGPILVSNAKQAATLALARAQMTASYEAHLARGVQPNRPREQIFAEHLCKILLNAVLADNGTGAALASALLCEVTGERYFFVHGELLPDLTVEVGGMFSLKARDDNEGVAHVLEAMEIAHAMAEEV